MEPRTFKKSQPSHKETRPSEAKHIHGRRDISSQQIHFCTLCDEMPSIRTD